MGIAFFIISIPTYLICLVVGCLGYRSALRRKNSTLERIGELQGFMVSTVLSFLLLWIGTFLYDPNVGVFFCVVGITPNVIPIIVGGLFLNRMSKFSAGAFMSVWFGLPYSFIWLEIL